VQRPIVDDAGRPVRSDEAPHRVVSLVPNLTELVCCLGAAADLVGVTRYCTEPAPVVASLPKLGGTKNPDVAAVVALRPDLVLVNAEENRREDFERLRDAGLRLFVSFPRSVEAAARSIENLGVVLHRAENARRLGAEIDRALAELAAEGPPRCRYFCPIWRKPWMTFNRDTFPHDLLRHAGGENVCGDAATRYPEVDLEELASRRPEIVLLPDEPYPFSEKHLDRLEALAETPACRRGRVHLVDGKALWWYGPRTPGSLRAFRRLLTAT
jgi:ABC-type Fe3+-hydroxamate transport system substrate-binding protein